MPIEHINSETEEMMGKKGIPGSTLKLIAVGTMLIDHIAATILERYLAVTGGIDYGAQNLMQMYQGPVAVLYLIMRLIGRLAFPLFAFMLVEGFLHTRNILKYALRIFLFAVITEVPFDQALSGKWFDMRYQNVLWTMLLGLLTLLGMKELGERIEKEQFRNLVQVLVAAAGFVAAHFANTDYGGAGVLTIVVLYLFRQRKQLAMGLGCAVLIFLSSPLEVTALFDLPLVKRYNGGRGLKSKYFFYIFYPGHLALLAFLCRLMGLKGVL